MRLILKKTANETDNPKTLNLFVHQRLGHHQNATAYKSRYYGNDCHLVPQSDYIYNQRGDRIIQHILRYEHLRGDFEKLAHCYGLPGDMIIPMKQKSRRKGLGDRGLSVSDLSDTAMKAIEKRYQKDFEVFGYKMLSTKAKMLD